MEQDGKLWKVMESNRKLWKVMEPSRIQMTNAICHICKYIESHGKL